MKEITATTLCAGFCGVGKSYLCNNFPSVCAELECWNYQNQKGFPDNYIDDIVLQTGRIKYLFISTNPIVLRRLYNVGYEINLYYPENKLKEEYFARYIERDSHPDFMEAVNKYWGGWLDELKEQSYCRHTVLKKGEYLQDVLINF